jgi:hypothetical protein
LPGDSCGVVAMRGRIGGSPLRDCLLDRPGGVNRNALNLHIMRLRRRIRPLGLLVRNVRGRCYLLETLDEAVRGHGQAQAVSLTGYGRRTTWMPAASRPFHPAEVAS